MFVQAPVRQGQSLFVPGNTPHLNPLPQGERRDGNQVLWDYSLSPKGRGEMGIKYSGTTPSPLRGEGWGEGDVGPAPGIRRGPSLMPAVRSCPCHESL
jgi:hypothetical protein